MRRIIDMTGRKFGFVTIIAYHTKQSLVRGHEWKCLCSCGATFISDIESMRGRRWFSCGCKREEMLRERGECISEVKRKKAKWSGASAEHKVEFTAWYNMIQRCSNKDHPMFPDYGGRGIVVCQRWMDSFWHFFQDMGKRPSPRLSIERKDNNLGYSPENCEWATYRRQSRNNRRNHNITWNGTTKCLTDWAAEFGVTVTGLVKRFKKHGVEKAMDHTSKFGSGRMA